jgi:hypothetical protein
MPRWPRVIASFLLLVLGLQLAGTGARCIAGPGGAEVAQATAHEHSAECPDPNAPDSGQPQPAHHGDCAMLAHCAALSVLPAAMTVAPSGVITALPFPTGDRFVATVTTQPAPPPPRA